MASATVATGVLVVFLLVGATLVAGGAVAVVQLARLRRRAASGGVRDGLVALDGLARPLGESDPLTSGLAGREALCYEFEVRRVGGGPGRRGWEEPTIGRDGVPFVLETGDGRVLVDPDGADLALEPSLDATVDADDREALASACESVRAEESRRPGRVGDVDLPAEGRYRVVERRLEPGDHVVVTGPATVDATTRPPPDPAGDPEDVDALVPVRPDPGVLRRYLDVPFVVGDAGIDRPSRRLVDRAIAALVFGLPLVGLALALLLPPPGL